MSDPGAPPSPTSPDTPAAPRRRRRWLGWLIAAVVVVVAVAVIGPFVYIHFIESDAPPPLTLGSIDASTTTTAGGTTGASTATTSGAAVPLDGTWTASSASQAGYRVKETLFGQSTEAVGRTNAVTAKVTFAGQQVTAATFTVDLTKVTSDQSQRDQQFQSRIMNTSKYPTATFELTSPIDLPTIPADGATITVNATGNLTMHGTTKSVTVPLTAKRSANTISVSGSIPITFADYGIDNPSAGPATVGNTGTLEFAIALQPA